VFTFNPPLWVDNVLADTFAVGTPYSDSVSATNSPSYTITAGALPAGISLNSVTGAVTGTPTTAGVYSFTIRAANADGAVTATYSGTVTAVPAWTDQTLGNFLQGRAYSDGVVATNSPSYSVTAGTLPAGTSLNSATGLITGTPTGTGAYSFTITATNTYGSITANFSGTIKLPPNWIDNQLGSFITGVEYSDSVTASNSPTYSVTTGSLPAGISLASSTGVVSGTPTGAVGTSYSFTITATNADGSIAQDYSGTIQPDLGGNLKLFADGQWSDKEVYVYDGTTWVRGTVYLYSGTAWSKSVF
jgi:predicted hotdog family 3-hydroxylacyl-ACP dehydratase